MAWIMTDDDSFQHIRQNDDGTFDCIEIDCVDFSEEEICYVVEGTVDVDAFIKENGEEAEMLAHMYGYDSVQDIRDSMKDAANQIIAEMLFESMAEFKNNVFSGTYEECRAYIEGKTK